MYVQIVFKEMLFVPFYIEYYNVFQLTSGFSTFLAGPGAAADAPAAAPMPTSASSSDAFFCRWGFLENK